MKTIKNIDDFLNESLMSRIKYWIENYEIAGLSAFRYKLENISENTLLDIPLGDTYTKAQNIKRNRDLKAALLGLGYGATRVTGSYLEDGKHEVLEESYIVVNLNGDKNFKINISILSEFFNQDSFLYSPLDSIESYLIGTNSSEFPGYGESVYCGKFKEKVNATYLSRIGSTGFAFISDDNPESEHKYLTFKDRKMNRQIKLEMVKYFHIESMEQKGINTRFLISKYSKPILEKLKSVNSKN
jgi:hypothetical protein